MRTKLGIFSAMILSLTVAGSALAGTPGTLEQKQNGNQTTENQTVSKKIAKKHHRTKHSKTKKSKTRKTADKTTPTS